jgi:hypothetical protein
VNLSLGACELHHDNITSSIWTSWLDKNIHQPGTVRYGLKKSMKRPYFMSGPPPDPRNILPCPWYRRQVVWFCTPNPNSRKVRSAHTLPTLAQGTPCDVIYNAGQPNKATRNLGFWLADGPEIKEACRAVLFARSVSRLSSPVLSSSQHHLPPWPSNRSPRPTLRGGVATWT